VDIQGIIVKRYIC